MHSPTIESTPPQAFATVAKAPASAKTTSGTAMLGLAMPLSIQLNLSENLPLIIRKADMSAI